MTNAQDSIRTAEFVRGAGSRILLAVCTVAAIAGCATQNLSLPRLETEGDHLHGKVIWHDLVTPTPSSAKNFYGHLFGWTFEQVGGGYWLVRNDGRLIAGLAKVKSSSYDSHWLPVVSVADVDKTVGLATGAGGKVLLRPFDLEGRGRVAVLTDPWGAAFSVARTTEGDPSDREAGFDEWLWNEVWTGDVAAAEGFYSGLAELQAEERSPWGAPYRYLSSRDVPRFGLLEKPDPEIGNTWVSYIRVGDVAATVERARALGGSILMEPRADLRAGTVAIIADPQGAGFVVQEVED